MSDIQIHNAKVRHNESQERHIFQFTLPWALVAHGTHCLLFDTVKCMLRAISPKFLNCLKSFEVSRTHHVIQPGRKQALSDVEIHHVKLRHNKSQR